MKNALLLGALSLVLVLPVRAEEKMAKIKDERKSEIVKKMGQQMCDLNKRRTQEMEHKITRINEILKKLEARGGNAGQANLALEEARNAVSNQSAKNDNCEIKITNEKKLKEQVKDSRENLRGELKMTHEKVETARRAAVDAIKTYDESKKQNQQ